MSDIRHETEVLLRAVLLSNKDGLLVEELMREFKYTTGKKSVNLLNDRLLHSE
jgi:hypothetical protein